MEIKERIYIGITKLMPRSYVKDFDKLLVYAGEKTTAESWLGSVTLIAILGFVIALLVPWSLSLGFKIIYLVYALTTFGLIEFGGYLIIYFKAEDRTNRVEDALPDVLELISANLKAGMTPFQALKLSAREEFGPLKDEIQHATGKAFGTENFSKALLSISKRVNSGVLDRTLKLFTTSMKSGGHLAKLLEELANDIAETRSLKRQLVTSTKTYVMFILFTIIVGAPLLLSISIHFVKMISETSAQTGATNAAFGMAFLAGEIELTPDFLTKVSIVLLIVTGLLASMLIGTIKDGKIKNGLKFAPFIIIACLIVFAIAKYFIGGFVGALT